VLMYSGSPLTCVNNVVRLTILTFVLPIED
jgi:hypothetical protein